MAKIPFDIKYRPQIESGEYKVIDQFGYVLTLRDIINDVWYFSLRYPNTDYETERIYDHPENHLFLVTPEPELSEFEDALKDCVNMWMPENPMTDVGARNNATILRAIAFKEFKENEASHMKEFVEQKEKEAYEKGKAEALRTRVTELTENLAKSGLDIDSIPYHLIEFMCNLYTCQNWKEIEETAELYATRIKAAAMKDLPRWKKAYRTCYIGDSIVVDEYGYYRSETVKQGSHYILINDIEKLPGFNEED